MDVMIGGLLLVLMYAFVSCEESNCETRKLVVVMTEVGNENVPMFVHGAERPERKSLRSLFGVKRRFCCPSAFRKSPSALLFFREIPRVTLGKSKSNENPSCSSRERFQIPCTNQC